MEAVAGILLLIALTALLSAGIAFMLFIMRPAIEWKRRALISAITGAGVPIVLLSMVVVLANGCVLEGFIAVFMMLLMGALMAAVVCFPAAYFLTRRLERRSGAAD
jgi:hypothetical protein